MTIIITDTNTQYGAHYIHIVGAYVRFVPAVPGSTTYIYSRHIEITLRLPLELHESYKFDGGMIMAGIISDLLSERVRYPLCEQY